MVNACLYFVNDRIVDPNYIFLR